MRVFVFKLQAQQNLSFSKRALGCDENYKKYIVYLKNSEDKFREILKYFSADIETLKIPNNYKYKNSSRNKAWGLEK